jgi:hypothetical protein
VNESGSPEVFIKDHLRELPLPDPPPEPPPPPDGRPQIEIRNGEMQRAVDEAEEALIAAQAWSPVEKKVFRRGDRIVSLAIDKGPDHKGGTAEGQIIGELGQNALAERLATAASFVNTMAALGGEGG